MSNDLAKLALIVDGHPVVVPCLEVMALSKLPKDVASEGYVRFYEAFAKRFGSGFTYYQLNDSTRWKRFQPKDRYKLSSWFSGRRTLEAPLLGIDIHTGHVAETPQLPMFQMFFEHGYPEYPRGTFRLVFPVDGIPDDLLDLVDDAMAEFPVHWGTAGYAFYWKDTDWKIEKYAEQWLRGPLLRHPGLATGDYMTWGSLVEEGVCNIGWLTFLGDALIDRLGGRDALVADARAAGIEVRFYQRGVALQAGSRPELGDVNRRHLLPSYREVGRIVEPVFAPEDVLEKIVVTGLQDQDESLAWLRRFLP
jgi:hypothetical protein